MTSETSCHESTVDGSNPSESSNRSAPVVRPSPQHLSRGKRALSTSTTSRPARASVIAAAAPAGPPPTTATSADNMTLRVVRRFRSAASRADQRDEEHRRLGTRIAPAMARPVLHERVARIECDFGAVVELTHDLSRDHDFEVHGVGGVYPGV